MLYFIAIRSLVTFIGILSFSLSDARATDYSAFNALLSRSLTTQETWRLDEYSEQIIAVTPAELEAHLTLAQHLNTDRSDWILGVLVDLRTPYFEVQIKILEAALNGSFSMFEDYFVPLIHDGIFTAEAETFLASQIMPKSQDAKDIKRASKAISILSHLAEGANLRAETLAAMQERGRKAVDWDRHWIFNMAFYVALRAERINEAESIFEIWFRGSEHQFKQQILLHFNQYLGRKGNGASTITNNGKKLGLRRKIVDLLFECLASENARVRQAALFTLDGLGIQAESLTRVLRVLLDHFDFGVRIDAAVKLAKMVKDRATLVRIAEMATDSLLPAVNGGHHTHSKISALGAAIKQLCFFHGLASVPLKAINRLVQQLPVLSSLTHSSPIEEDNSSIGSLAISQFALILIATAQGDSPRQFNDRSTLNPRQAALFIGLTKIKDIALIDFPGLDDDRVETARRAMSAMRVVFLSRKQADDCQSKLRDELDKSTLVDADDKKD